MAETLEAMTPNLAERWCWQAARRNDARVARRLARKPVVDGVDRLDEGAWLDHLFSCWHERGVVDWRGEVPGAAVQREMGPCVPDLLLAHLKTRCGIEGMQAVPAMLLSAVARRRLVGFKAHQARHGVCQWGVAPRQGPRRPGPIWPEALAETLVPRNGRDLEASLNGATPALARAGVGAAKGTGIIAAPELDTPTPDQGGGPATCQRQVTDTHGQVPEIAATVDGWKLLGLMAAHPKSPVAATVGPIQEQEPLSLRALVPPAPSWPALSAGPQWAVSGALGIAPLGGGWRCLGGAWWCRPKTRGP
jgi:hypothetical protein